MLLAELQQALSAVEPAAVLVPPRVLENMLRQSLRNTGFVWQVPHRRSFIVDRQTLFRTVDQEELALAPDQLLPQTVVLIAWPESDELERSDRRILLRKYWQRLFHSSIHLALDNRLMEGHLTAAVLRERIDALGEVCFDEIREVLTQEAYLPPAADDRAVYVEFAAVFSELSYFLPHLVPIYFPTVHNVEAVRALLRLDVDVTAILARTRLAGASEPAAGSLSGSEEAHEYYGKLIQASNQAIEEGNIVRAAVLRQRASRVAPPARAHTTRHAAVTLLLGLLDRLQRALELSPPDVEEWRKHLPALLDKADQGARPVEAALLYDLQNVCLDYEREIYAVDLVKWVTSGFRRPIMSPLPKERQVRVTRTVRVALPRLALARLNDEDRNQFANLLQDAVRRSEEKVRSEFRPALTSALHDVGLDPANPLEATAFNKVVEELIDRIIESGFITFSDLRDTLSRNSLKLPDLSDPQDFIRGDPLLRLDRRLGTLLDGVYRPSEFYLRWLEVLTALNFGTPLGRVLTRYVTVPALAALLVLELFTFSMYLLQGKGVIKKYDDVVWRAPDMGTLQEFLTWKPGYVTQYEERLFGFWQGKLWVHRDDGKEHKFEHPATANWEGPLGRLSVAADDERTLQEYLAWKLGFNVFYEGNGKLWVFRKKAESQEPTKDPADDQWDSPAGRMTLLAPDKETLQAYRDEPFHRPPQLPIDFVEFGVKERFTGEPRQWVFRKDDERGKHFQPAEELPWEIPSSLRYPAWIVLALFFVGLLHSARVRQDCVNLATAVARPLRRALVDGPLWIVQHTSFKEIIATWSFQLFYWYIFKPAILAGLLWLLLPGLYRNFLVSVLLFATAEFFIISRPGQAIGDTMLQATIRLGQMLRAGLIPALLRLVIEVFKQIMHFGERLLFTVEEWLRFRGGDSRPLLIARAVFSVLWFPVAYLIRFNLVVLIEPCLNPLKFPIVSIATKLMLPILPLVRVQLSERCAEFMGSFLADVVSVWITFWLPDVFGFMFWEMKENWSLYRANRRRELGPVAVDQHGQTLRSLLQPGFHSGTVPKLFTRLRHAERQARHTGSFGSVRACQAALAEVEKSVHLFITREFCELLGRTSTWQGRAPQVGAIGLATNQIRVELRHDNHAGAPLWLAFENRGSSLCAEVSAAGWFTQLAPAEQVVTHNALAVLFKLAGADRVDKPGRVAAPAANEAPALPLRQRDFSAMPITWERCVECWNANAAAAAPAPLLDQSSLWFVEPPKLNGQSHKEEPPPAEEERGSAEAEGAA